MTSERRRLPWRKPKDGGYRARPNPDIVPTAPPLDAQGWLDCLRCRVTFHPDGGHQCPPPRGRGSASSLGPRS